MQCRTKLNNPSLIDGERYPPEIEEGPIEYKLRLDLKSNVNLGKMVSQMKWRVNEGIKQYGISQAIYVLGVFDDGTFSNLTKEELNISYNILKKEVVNISGLKILDINYVKNSSGKQCICTTIGKNQKSIPSNKNIIIIGENGVGKTTLLGRLVDGCVDTGDGYVRDMMLKHVHEKECGETTSVKIGNVGLLNRCIINNSPTIENDFRTFESSFDDLDYTLDIYDTPGSSKYFNRVISLVYSVPFSLLILVVDADRIEYRPEHIKYLLDLAVLLKIPILKVINKCSNKYQVPDGYIKMNLTSPVRNTQIDVEIVNACYKEEYSITEKLGLCLNPEPIYTGVESYTITHLGGCIIIGISTDIIKKGCLYTIYTKGKFMDVMVKSIHAYGREIDKAPENCSVSINVIDIKSSRPISLSGSQMIAMYPLRTAIKIYKMLNISIPISGEIRGILISNHGIEKIKIQDGVIVNGIYPTNSLSTLIINNHYYTCNLSI